MASIFLWAFTKNILVDKLYMDNSFTRTVFFEKAVTPRININWRELYPFTTHTNTTKNNRLSMLRRRFTNIEAAIEKYAKDDLVNQSMFAEWVVQLERAIGWNFLNNDVVDLGEGHLSKTIEKYAMTENAASLAALYDFLRRLTADFLYVQVPHKISPADSISGRMDFSNENADNLLYALNSLQIPYLDLRENIREEGLSHHDLFYKTDHHWKVETGLWASRILMNYLNKNYGFSFDLRLFDPNEYSYTLYEDWFFGSLGRKVTLARASPEDFTLVTPKFDTDYSLISPSLNLNLDVRGNFDILINQTVNTRKYYTVDSYSAYMYGDRDVARIHNFLAPGGKSILLIKDSFSNVVSPFLIAGAEDIHILDLRYFNGSVRSYIEKNNPDMVIVMYNPSVFVEEYKKMFNF
jgi:hypothetical protein